MRHDTNPWYPSRNAEAGLREDQRSFLETATVSLGLPSLLYASLRDPRLFETVIGRPMDACEWERATLRGFRLGVVNAGTGFPGVFPAADPAAADLKCIVMHDLSRFEQTMVAWYEWDEYLLRRIPLADGRTAQVFAPNLEAIRREHGRFTIEPWTFEAWQCSHANRALVDAREWMARRPSTAALVHAGCFAPEESPGDGRATG